jgi:hypothetical protein
MALTTYASDVIAITTLSAAALELDAADVVDAGALEPEEYVQAESNIGGTAQVYVSFVKWFLPERHTNGVHLFAHQYAVTVRAFTPEEFADCIARALILRDALNGRAYRMGTEASSKGRKLYVTDGFPRFDTDLSIHSIQFFVDVI